jgi:hypothetical protein
MEDRTISTNDLFSDYEDGGNLIAESAPRFHRRLSDKILAAFTHAYVLDEVELASTLYACLVSAEEITEAEDKDRADNQALGLAQYWIKLVDSKRRYEAILSNGGAPGDPNAEDVRNEMRTAFAAWYRQFEAE